MSALRYAIDEASLSLWRRRRANGLSVLTITIALFVLGVFLLLHANIQHWLADWSQAAEVSVYLASDLSAEQRAAIEEVLTHNRAAVSREYVSPDEAMRRFARLFPELAASARTIGDQALPASFEVRLAPGAGTDNEVDLLAAELRKLPGVTDVRYDRRWIARLAAVAAAGRLAGIALATILVVAAAMTVASVVRLALHARRDEIDIMQLVGAPLAYIRGPFIVEGVLQGGVGATTALAGLYVTYLVARTRFGALTTGLGVAQVQTLAFLPPLWMLGLIGGGMVVGCLGGIIASRSAR